MIVPTPTTPLCEPKTIIVAPVELYDKQGLFFGRFDMRLDVGPFLEGAKDKYEAISVMLVALFPDYNVVCGRMSTERIENTFERSADGNYAAFVERKYVDGVLWSESFRGA